jgi:putative CocE/NonD family hydrolase
MTSKRRAPWGDWQARLRPGACVARRDRRAHRPREPLRRLPERTGPAPSAGGRSLLHPMRKSRVMRARLLGAALILLVTAGMVGLASAGTPTMTPDDIANYNTITPFADYVRRDVFIRMRDGVRLYTVILMKKGTRHGPILLTRTPYGASRRAQRAVSQKLSTILAPWNSSFVESGYIRVFQDIRGRGRSGGVFVANRPVRGPLNPTGVDESTDAFDTIEWLSGHVPESNGRVAVIGGSYDGWLALMATIHPSPALKAAVAINPMVDLWMGDDWFHHGAFRQATLVVVPIIMEGSDGGGRVASGPQDAYSLFLGAGSAGDYIRKYGLDQFPYVRKLMEHPAYDAWWRGQALDRLLAQRPLEVPTLLVASQWDEQDLYGATAVYRALKPKDTDGDKIFLALGPWRHMGALESDGRKLGALRFGSDTARQFRRQELRPFLDETLASSMGRISIPAVFAYATGAGEWQRLGGLPAVATVPLYLRAGFSLSYGQPRGDGSRSDAYASDPAKPVPFVPRPFLILGSKDWQHSLIADHRFASDRTDVLTYMTEPLTAPVHILGWPKANLFASTTGTDADWIVKLIDVYPQEYAEQPDLAGYQLGVAMDVFRGRYLHGYDRPEPLIPGRVEHYQFELPMVDHVFEKGHRIMVQIQSSWFPMYDRNPQTFVPNIFDAKPGDYRQATQRVFRDPRDPSSIELPVLPNP